MALWLESPDQCFIDKNMIMSFKVRINPDTCTSCRLMSLDLPSYQMEVLTMWTPTIGRCYPPFFFQGRKTISFLLLSLTFWHAAECRWVVKLKAIASVMPWSNRIGPLCFIYALKWLFFIFLYKSNECSYILFWRAFISAQSYDLSIKLIVKCT